MQVILDYKAGERVICLINNRFSVETLTGAARIVVDTDGKVSYALYEIDRCDCVYTSTKMTISSECIFRTKADALASVGLSEITD